MKQINLKSAISESVSVWWWYLFLGLLSVGNLLRFQITATVAIGVIEIFVGCCLLAWTAQEISKNKLKNVYQQGKKILTWKVQFASLLLITAVLVGWSVALEQGTSSFVEPVYLSRYISIVVFGVWITHKIVAIKGTEFVINGLLAVCLLLSWFGWIQYFFFPDTRFLSILGWDDHYYRLLSTWLDPTYTGWVFAIATVASIFHTHKKFSTFILFLTGLFALSLAFTYSRSSMLALAVVELVLLIHPQVTLFRKKIILTSLLFLLAVVMILPKPASEGTNLLRTASIQAKVDSIATAHKQVRSTKTVLFGTGLFSHQPKQERVELFIPNHATLPDSLFVLATQLGLLGCIGVALIAIEVFKNQSKNIFLHSILLATLVHSLFTNTWLHPLVLLVLVPMCVLTFKRKSELNS